MTAPFDLELSQTSRQRGFVRERRGAARVAGSGRDALVVQTLGLPAREAAHALAGLDDVVAKLAGVDPHLIVQVVEHGSTEDGAPFVVERGVEAPTLGERLEAGPLDVEDAMTLALALAETLADAHAQGLAHGALRPEAVRMPGSPRIGDWGVGAAMPVAVQRSAEALRACGRHVSPEQARGEAWGAPSDVFQWATTVFEAVTGEPAFVAPTPIGVLTHIARGRGCAHPALDALPPELSDLLRRAWSPSPTARPTAQALVDALGQLVGETDITSLSEPLPPDATPIAWDESPLDATTEPQREVPNHLDEDDLPTLAYAPPRDEMVTVRDQASDAVAALLERRLHPVAWPPAPPLRTVRLDAPLPPRDSEPQLTPARLPEAVTWALVACGAASAVAATTLLAIWLAI